MSDSRIWTDEQRAPIFDLARKGLSARHIARLTGTTRNTVIGQINRHAPDRVKKDRETAKSVGSAVFVGPAAPRRFSWEEGV